MSNITSAEARKLLDDLDDYARMEVSIDPVGPVKALTEFIAQYEALAAQNQAMREELGDYQCEDCIGMKDHGCYCKASGAIRPGGPSLPDLATPILNAVQADQIKVLEAEIAAKMSAGQFVIDKLAKADAVIKAVNTAITELMKYTPRFHWVGGFENGGWVPSEAALLKTLDVCDEALAAIEQYQKGEEA